MKKNKKLTAFLADRLWRTAVCTLAALALASCSKEKSAEQGLEQPELPGEPATVQLRISIPDMEQVLTRSSDSTVVKMYVATFNASGNMTDAPQEAIPVSAGADGSGLYFSASLRTSAAKRTVVLFANAEAELNAFQAGDGGSWRVQGIGGVTAATSTKLAQMKLFQFANLPTTSGYITSQPAFPLPMVAEVPVNSITNGMTINAANGYPVLLQRAVAKFTVKRDAALTDDIFTLQGATLGNALPTGLLFMTHVLDDASAVYTYSSSPTSPEVMAGAVDNSQTEPLYGHESSKDHPNPLFVIIKASYKGRVVYYRAEIFDGTLGGTRKRLDIIRNHHYVIQVKSVDNPGYSSMAEALDSRGSNIGYEVTVTVPTPDTNDDAHDIVSNGDYFLGLSNSNYVFYADGAQTGLTLARITHNASPAVSTATIRIEGTGLTLIANSGYSVAGNVATIDTSVKTFDLKINAANTFTDSHTGTVTIELGNLTKKITIRRKPMLTSLGGVLSDFSDPKYVTASLANSSDSWLKFSRLANGSDASVEINNPSGRIYPVVSPYYLFDAGSARNLTAYISSNDATGRTRVFMTQTYGLLELDLRYVDPSASNYAGYLDAHYDSRPIKINAPATKIDILKSDGSPIGAGDDWLRFSHKSTYPLAGERTGHANQLRTSEVIANASDTWRYLYADENVTGADRGLILRFTFANSQTELSTNPMATKDYHITQRTPDIAGLFGGVQDTHGYTQPLGVEHNEEYDMAFKTGDVTRVGVFWGFNNITIYEIDKVHGMEATSAMARLSTHGITGTLDPLYNTYAARYCYEKNRDLDGNGQLAPNEIKWYLPAQNQLMGIYAVRNGLTTTFHPTYLYWSATRFNNTTSFASLLTSGRLTTRSKNTYSSVRCVRDM